MYLISARCSIWLVWNGEKSYREIIHFTKNQISRNPIIQICLNKKQRFWAKLMYLISARCSIWLVWNGEKSYREIIHFTKYQISRNPIIHIFKNKKQRFWAKLIYLISARCSIWLVCEAAQTQDEQILLTQGKSAKHGGASTVFAVQFTAARWQGVCFLC